MNTTKHTPGPWNYAHGSTDLLTHDGDDVAYVDTAIPERSKAEQQANARLIAAAPCLLAFAQKVSDGGHDMADLMTEARSVIAKATNP